MTAIRDLVFASPSRLRTAFSFLRYGRFQFPETQEEEERTLSRLMWKLGFSTRTYPTHHQRLWELIASVRTSASSADLSRDVDRQDIRGQASNLFVLLEEVLDLSLGFSTWALLSDHLAGSGFVYDPAIARRFMARASMACEALTWLNRSCSTRVGVTPSSRSFRALERLGWSAGRFWIRPITTRGRGMIGRISMRRGSTKVSRSLTRWPFATSEQDQDRVLTLLRDTTRELHRANISDLRNRLEHGLREFPTPTEILDGLEVVSRAIAGLEGTGLAALVSYPGPTTFDEFGRFKYEFTDYRGRTLSVIGPPQHPWLNMPSMRGPQVIVDYMRVGDSAEAMRFAYRESSPFSDMWRDYPRRAAPPPSEDEVDLSPDPSGSATHDEDGEDPQASVPS
jgi:hypothetical protein